MPYRAELSQWTREVSSHLGHLSRSQAGGLALYSYAVMLTQSCGLSQVAYFLGQLLGQRENTVRQRLREVCYEAGDKRGKKRREVEVSRCFAPLLRWVQQLWRSEEQEMVLALDATTLRQLFTVLSVSVLLRGFAIPVAWVVLPATQAGAWKPHWQRLLAEVKGGLSADYRVWVTADRGLYAKWLFTAIQANGWHPLLRINAQGTCCVRHSGRRWSLAMLAALCRHRLWREEVVCFKDEARLPCTLLAMWEESHQAAWLLLTDVPPLEASPSWYALRMGIEAGFKALKSAGFHWQRTRMSDPARAERLWLVLALAALRAASAAAGLPPPPPQHPWPSQPRPAGRTNPAIRA